MVLSVKVSGLPKKCRNVHVSWLYLHQKIRFHTVRKYLCCQILQGCAAKTQTGVEQRLISIDLADTIDSECSEDVCLV